MKNSANLKIETLDFSKNEDYDAYLKLFRCDNFEKDYPNFFKILEATKQNHQENGGCDYKSLLQMTAEDFENRYSKRSRDENSATNAQLLSVGKSKKADDQSPWVDGVYIDWLYRDSDSNKLKGQVTASFVEKKASIMMVVTLKCNGVERQCTGQATNLSQYIYSFECDDFASASDTEDIEVDINVSSIDSSMMLTSQRMSDVNFIDLNANSPVGKIAVVDPENIKSDFGKFVTIAYGRETKSGEALDYAYEDSSTIKFPFTVYVFLKENYKYIDIRSVRLLLDCESGTTQYSNIVSDKFKTFDLGFYWRFDEDWGQKLDEKRTPKDTRLTLHMNLEYVYTDNSGNPPKMDTIRISSSKEDNSVANPAYQQIPYLRFLWGCLGKDTLIVMANGEEKKISEIEANELILNGDGERKIVSRVLKGYEETIIHISTKEKGTILATHEHPFMTDKGLVAANFLTKEHKLLLENGDFAEITEAYETKYEDDVYNLTLKDETKKEEDTTQTMIANGYVVGDNTEQNRLSKKNEDVVELAPELLSEITALFSSKE